MVGSLSSVWVSVCGPCQEKQGLSDAGIWFQHGGMAGNWFLGGGGGGYTYMSSQRNEKGIYRQNKSPLHSAPVQLWRPMHNHHLCSWRILTYIARHRQRSCQYFHSDHRVGHESPMRILVPQRGQLSSEPCICIWIATPLLESRRDTAQHMCRELALVTQRSEA